ncbi:hemolysin family protein [Peptoniphilus indolicus]|uniref:CBS domain protein n=2 Tax=Peptoniphilus indolicus TaxID=33030 RepID=G4D6Y1_9FIRM|nr:hemolysin family protein [Peptoniphilus indolicus]EGY76341.1 CBS domain protein [Peptoniphilus indolicus ATCC 29427]SUB74535.1 Putative Mg2+ and Co2+ transporter CorB [Peptoniphilus indolicus]
MDGAGGSIILQFLLIAFLTWVNAFFASAEMAMVSANRNKIQTLVDEGNKKAIILKKILSDQTRFLSTIQVGITFANFFSSASAATTISRVFATQLNSLGIPYAQTIALVLITLLLSYITLVCGELVPKRIALTNADEVALKSATVIGIVSKFAYPFVKLLSFSTTLILKILGKYSEDVEEKISEEELKAYIKVSQEQGVINSAGEEMIVNIMEFDDTMAYEIMTPRTSIFMVDYDEFNEDTVVEILKMGYSRVPVFKDNRDNIIGTVYIKDLFIDYSKTNYKSVNIDNVMKEPYFVPETKKVDSLLKELQLSKKYVAILIDEYGGFSGMVTMEDLVEEIVGEIEDEYDKDEPKIEKIADDRYLIDGYVEIDVINEKLGTKLYSENHETISGLMIELLGYIPQEDETGFTVVYEDMVELKGLNVKDNRIALIELRILKDED